MTKYNLPQEEVKRFEVYKGKNTEWMPKLIADGRMPANVSQLMQRILDLRNDETLLEQNYKHDRLNLNAGAILNGLYSVVEVFSEPEEITGAKFKVRKVA